MDPPGRRLNLDAHPDDDEAVVPVDAHPDDDEATLRMQAYDDYLASSLLFGPPLENQVDYSDDMMPFLAALDDISFPSLPTSPEDFSSNLAQASISPTIPLDTPLPWDYNDLQANIAYDPALQEAFYTIIDKIITSTPLMKADFQNFVSTRRGRYICAVEGCTWHERGWKREDRGVAHVRKEHFRLVNYRCHECDRDYNWPHDLKKHRKLKHPQEGEAPPPTYQCPQPDCGQIFVNSFNLNRHRQVHRNSAAARRRARL